MPTNVHNSRLPDKADRPSMTQPVFGAKRLGTRLACPSVANIRRYKRRVVALKTITMVTANNSKPPCITMAAAPRTIARPNKIVWFVARLRANSIDKIVKTQREIEGSILAPHLKQ